MSTEWAPESVVDVLGDELARRILVVASERPVSAEELASVCEASKPTVYRRINGLESLDLLSPGTRVRPDGNHVKQYETVVRRVAVEIGEGGLDVSIRRDLPGRFEAFWEELEQSSRELPGSEDVDPAPGGEGAHRG